MSLYHMSKNVWGPPTWQVLHCMALKAKETMTFPQLQELKQIMERMVANLPCPMCSGHATAYFKQHHFQRIQTLQQLQMFLFQFHNSVNTRIKKPLITYEEHLLIYRPMSIDTVVRNMFQVYQHMNNTSVTMMLYSFHRKTILQDLHKYFRQNNHLFYV
jgi:hypothetical protein